MNTPDKNDWFVQWLDEKFEALTHLINDNKREHDESKTEIHGLISTLDEKHDKKHENTRRFFIVAIMASAIIFIKESRDLIITLFKLLV